MDIVSTILVCEGAAVTCAASAAEALVQYIGDGAFDVVISDLAMPIRDGFWLVRQLKREAADQARPLRAVALSAHAQDEVRREALEAGFDVFLAKPFDVANLRAAIAGPAAADPRRRL